MARTEMKARMKKSLLMTMTMTKVNRRTVEMLYAVTIHIIDRG
jgi:hypothetical protein